MSVVLLYVQVMPSQLLLQSGEKTISSRGVVWAVSAVIAHVLQALCELHVFEIRNRLSVRYVLCAQHGDMKLMLMLEMHMFIIHLRLRHGVCRRRIYICHNKNIHQIKVIHFSKNGMLAKLAVLCGFFEGASRPSRQGITANGHGGRLCIYQIIWQIRKSVPFLKHFSWGHSSWCQ